MSPLPQFESQIVVEDVYFQAGSNRLHGEFAYPETGSVSCGIVIAGPHPFLGGNTRNNVVRSLGDGLAQQGLATLRFNYRGVGRSEGPAIDMARHLAEFWQTSHAPDELDLWQDLQAAVEFLHDATPGVPVVLIGYSFGCVLLPQVQPRHKLAAMMLIAPTVGRHDFNPYQAVSTPLLVVTSDDDFVTGGTQLESWFRTLNMPRQHIQKRCDNHFFRGHEDWLIDTFFSFWSPLAGGVA